MLHMLWTGESDTRIRVLRVKRYSIIVAQKHSHLELHHAFYQRAIAIHFRAYGFMRMRCTASGLRMDTLAGVQNAPWYIIAFSVPLHIKSVLCLCCVLRRKK